MSKTRTLPPVDPRTNLIPPSPTQDYRRCKGCGHVAWMDLPVGDPVTWTCACKPGTCHGYTQVNTDGSPNLVAKTYTFHDVDAKTQY